MCIYVYMCGHIQEFVEQGLITPVKKARGPAVSDKMIVDFISEFCRDSCRWSERHRRPPHLFHFSVLFHSLPCFSALCNSNRFP